MYLKNKTWIKFNIKNSNILKWIKNEAKQLNKLYEKVGDLGSALSPNNVNSNNNNNNNNTDTQVESILKMKRNKSVVGDIKEVLKNVESTKSKIDLGLAQIERQRENNFFYLLNSNAEDTWAIK